MDLIIAIIDLIKFLVISAFVLGVSLLVLLIVISLMPKDNPLRHLLVALSKPLGVTMGVMVVTVPLEMVPLFDVVWDFVALYLVGSSWFGFANQATTLWPALTGHLSAKAPTANTLSAQESFARAQRAVAQKQWPEALHWSRFAAELGHAAAAALAAKAQAEQKRIEAEQEREQRDRGRRDAADTPMSRAEALEMLELAEGATSAQIMSAYKRLMQKVHPDKGGSTFFARQLNAARRS